MVLPQTNESALSPLAAALAPLKRHWRNVHVAEGACAVAAGVVAYVLVVGAVDRLALLAWPLRAALLLALLAVAAYVVVRHIIRPWKAEGHDEDAARLVDRRWPDLFPGHVLSAVQLEASAGAGQGSAESHELARIGVECVVRDLVCQRLVDAVPKNRLRYLAVAAGVLAMVATAALACRPRQSGVALARVVWLLNVEYPTRTTITSVEPGHAKMKEGQSLWLNVNAAGEIPETGSVHVTAADREPLELTLLRAGNDLFRVQLPQFDADFRYQVQLGDASSQAFRVQVLPQPRLSIVVRVGDGQGKQDTSAEERDAAAAGGNATVMEGSHLYIRADSTKPLVRASFESEPDISGLSVDVSGKHLRLPRIVATESFLYRLDVTDTEDVTNHPPQTYGVRVTPDLPPKIALRKEGETIAVLPGARVVLTYSATDDLGLDKIEMPVERPGASRERSVGERTAVPVAHCEGKRAVTGDFSWNLDHLALEPGDTVRVRMQAFDTRSLGANAAESGSLAIQVVTREQFAQQYREELARTVELHLLPLSEELRQLFKDTSAAVSPSDPAERDDRQLADRQAALNERLAEFDDKHWKPLAEWIQDNGVEREEPFTQLAAARRQVQDVGEQQLGAAAKALEAAAGPDPQQRSENLKQAADRQQAAQQTLNGLTARVLPFATLARCQGDLQKLLTAQTETMNATRACCTGQWAAARPPSPKTLQDLSERQGIVSRDYVELDRTLAQLSERPDMPGQVRSAFEAGRQSAVSEALAAATYDLQRGGTYPAFESQYDAYRGMLRQSTTLQTDERDRQTQAGELAGRLDQLLARQAEPRAPGAPGQARGDQPPSDPRSAAAWELQKAAEEAAAIDAEAGRSLQRALRETAKAAEERLAGNEEPANRRQETAQTEIAAARTRLQELAATTPDRPQADDLFAQADHWKQIQQEVERLAREQETAAQDEPPTGRQDESAQQDIADQSAKLAEQAKSQSGGSETARLLSEAASHARQAANDLHSRKAPADARQLQLQAADRMNQAAAAAAAQSDAARTQAQTEQMRQLQQAARQVDSARQESQESARNVGDLGSQPPQRTLEEMATDLDDQAERLQQLAESAPAGGESLQKAAEHSRKAAGELSQGNTGAAQQQQQMADAEMQTSQQDLGKARTKMEHQIASRERQRQELQKLQEDMASAENEMQSLKREMERLASGTQADSQRQADQQSQPEAGQPSQPEAGQPSQPEAGQPSQPQAGQPSQPQAGQPSQPQAGQPSQQQTGQQAGRSPEQRQGDLAGQLKQMAAGAQAGKQELTQAAASAEAASQAMQRGETGQAIQRQNEGIRSLDRARRHVSRSELALSPASSDVPFTAELMGEELVSNAPDVPVPDEPPPRDLEVDRQFETFMDSLIVSPPAGYETRLKDYRRTFRLPEKP